MENSIYINDLTLIKNNFPLLLHCSLSIEGGKFYKLSGENGAGKSSLLKVVENEYRKNDDLLVCSLYTQNIFPTYLNIENISVLLNNKKFVELINTIFNKPDVKKPFKDFSSGQKQIINIMALISLKPDVLILDEPFDHIDKQNSKSLCELLIELNKTGTTIVLASHVTPKEIEDYGISLNMSGGKIDEKPQTIPKSEIRSDLNFQKNLTKRKTQSMPTKVKIAKFELINFIKSGVTLKFLLPLLLSILVLGAFTTDPDASTFSNFSTTIIWLAVVTVSIALLPYASNRKNLYSQIGVSNDKNFFTIMISNTLVTTTLTIFAFLSSNVLFNQKIAQPILAVSIILLAGIGLGAIITIVSLITKTHLSVGAILLIPLLAPLSMGVVRSWESILFDSFQSKNWFVFLLSFVLILSSLSVLFSKDLINDES